MTINIFVLKGDLNEENRSGAFLFLSGIYEPRHLISNNVAFCQVQNQTTMCSLILSFETPNDVQSVA